MKKRILFTWLALGIAPAAFAQPVFEENFNTGIPSTFVLINDNNTPASQVAWATEAWSHFNSADFGGLARSTSWFSPEAVADRWLITPQITIPANGYLFWKAGAVDQSFADGYEVRMSSGGTSKSDFSTLLLSVPAEGAPMVNRAINLGAYANQQVRFAFVNNSDDKFILYIDDIKVQAISGLDVSAKSINVPTVIGLTPSRTISGTMENLGEVLTTLRINYSVNGGAPISQTLSNVNINPTEVFNYSFNTQWTPAALGTYTIKVWADQLNGNSDANPANDTATVVVNVIQGRDKYAVSEKFTSSTCPPCATWNNVVYKPKFSSQQWNTFNSKKLIVNYQVTIPSAGDPSVNDHGNVTRRQYYGINSAPTLVIGGERINWSDFNITTYAQASDVIDQLTNAINNSPATMGIDIIKAEVVPVGNRLKVGVYGKVDVDTEISAATHRLHIVVLQKNYTFMGATNGDTEYKHTMRRMLPDAQGTILPAMQANNAFYFDEEFTFDVGSVTGGSFNLWNNDVEVVVFVQNHATKEIMQGAYAYAHTVSVNEFENGMSQIKLFPNPANEAINLEWNATENGKAQIEILNALGQVVYSSVENYTEGANSININTSGYKAGLYFMNVKSNNSSRTFKFNVAH